MYDKILNFVLKYVGEYYPGVAFREGTGAYDLLVKAFCILYNTLFGKIETALNSLDVRNYASLSDEAMDRMAALWFVSRSQGGVAGGQVRLFLYNPVQVNVPAGFTVLSRGGLRFQTEEAYSFSESLIRNQVSGNRYYCDFAVVAAGTGQEYNIAAAEITDIESACYAPWSSITNLAAFTRGADREDNEALYNRLLQSVNTRNLVITKASALATLMDEIPTIIDMDILGFGDEGMIRDTVYFVMSAGGVPYLRSDFSRKTRGNTIFSKSVAYYGSLEPDDTTGLMPDPVPSPDELISDMDELEQASYDAIGAEDLVFGLNHGGEIIYDDFDDNLGEAQFNVPDWIVGDSGLPFGQKAYGNSVYITYNGKLRLGAEDWRSAPV